MAQAPPTRPTADAKKEADRQLEEAELWLRQSEAELARVTAAAKAAEAQQRLATVQVEVARARVKKLRATLDKAKPPAPAAEKPKPMPAKKLTVWEARLQQAEEEWLVQEEKWSEEIMAVRLKLLALDEKLAEAERELAKDRGLAEIEAKTVELLQKGTLPHELAKASERTNALKKRVLEREQEYKLLEVKIRRERLPMEEQIRLLERKQAFARDKARLRVEEASGDAKRAANPFRGLPASDLRLQEMERKLDALQREIARLRSQLSKP